MSENQDGPLSLERLAHPPAREPRSGGPSTCRTGLTRGDRNRGQPRGPGPSLSRNGTGRRDHRRSSRRAHLYDVLTDIGADKTAVSEMLAHFPSNDDDRPVTHHHLAAEMANIRAEMAKGFAATDTKIASLRTDMIEGIAAIRIEMADFSRHAM